MRKGVFAIICTVLLFASACTGTAQEARTIGVVDINRVFVESQAGQEGMEYLQNLNQDFQEEFSELQAQEEGDENATQQQLQEAISRYQARIGQEQQRIVALLNEKFLELLEEYRQESNLSVILSQESVLTMSEGVDVTPQVIEMFDEVEVDLEAEPELEYQEETAVPGVPGELPEETQ